MKSKKTKNILKKGVLWVLVLTMLFSTSALAAITAENFTGELPIEETDEFLKQAAEVQSIAHVMQKCIPSIAGYSGTSNNSENGSGDIFGSAIFKDTDITVGARLEKELYGNSSYKDNDGEIQCNDAKKDNEQNRVVVKFAQAIGRSVQEVVCNGEKPGLVGGYTNDVGLDSSVNCWEYFTADSTFGIYEHWYTYNNNYNGYTASGDVYSNGEGYVKALYDRYVEESGNPYLAKWDQLNDFSGGKGYFQTLWDFETGCGAEVNDNCWNSDDIGCEKIKVVSKNGATEKIWYRYYKNAKTQKSITGNQERTCGELASAINEYAKDYAKELKEKYASACNSAVEPYWAAYKAQAEVVLKTTPDKYITTLPDGKNIEYSNYTETTDTDGNIVQTMKDYLQEEKNEASEIIAEISGMESEGKFWEEGDDGGLVCKVPPQFSIVGDGPSGGDGSGIVPGTSDSCQGAGGAGALGWIVCPVMEWMGGAAKDIYEDFLKPQLQVSPTLFWDNSGVNSAEDAWKTFQEMANILFSIILLVVIFSQLTGVGIDNYGIKKILPKLILTAVLANLSFVICQLAVDVSNILGNSLQNLLSGMAGNVTSVSVDGVGDINLAGGIATGAVIVAALVGAVALFTNPAIILSLFVGALGVLIAILFIFILLAARQAAVLILVVISPLAFVCYALPNTKKLFDKWLNLMKGLLVVYPVCGLLIGGGDFASKLLLSGGNVNFIMAFTAMLVSIVPLFFVPTVLKNAMNALGGLGGKISGIGSRVGSGAKGLARNSRGYKNAQQRGNERADRLTARRRAGIHLDRNGNVQNNRLSVRRRIAGTGLGRLLGMDAAVGAAQSQYVKQEMDRRANINTFDNRGIVQSQVTKAQNAEDERIIAGQVGVARNTDMMRENIEKKAMKERAKAEVEMEVGAAELTPESRENMKQRLVNQVKEEIADGEVPVVPVELNLAVQRRKAAADSQELRNFTDQFANYSRDQLAAEASNANNWINGAGGTQRMQALLSTMESRGMENNIADMLEKGGDAIGNNAAVMQTLAGSKNRVFKAYGKAGAGMSYHDFMSGGKEQQQYVDASGNITSQAVDANGNANRIAYVDADTGQITTSATSVSGQQNAAHTRRTGKSIVDYARDKGADFINDLDDKALSQIAKYQTGADNTPRVQIMSDQMLAQAASRLTSQDAVDVLDNMIEDSFKNNPNGNVEFSAAQYANLNASTRQRLSNLMDSNASITGDSQRDAEIRGSIRQNLARISDEMVSAPEQRARLDEASIQYLDNARMNRTDGGDRRKIQDAIQSIQVPHGDNGNGGAGDNGGGNGGAGGTS